MLVLTNMADDGLTNLNWLVQQNPIAPLSASPHSLPYPLSHSSSSSVSSNGDYQNVSSMPDYSRERIKPPYSYAQMITMAMESHGGRKVLLTDIYSWIKDNFAYFRGNDTSWQNSVRHNLSLNKQFVKVPREQKDKGKGSYWQLDASSCNLPKDPYCLRRRNFADNGTSSKRIQRPEVSHPQVNPAIKTFLERVRRLQDARRHPFAGTGETLEDIGAQECVYADTEPLFDDFNRKLFKKDVELYDPSDYCPLISTCNSRKREAKDLVLNNLTPLATCTDGDPPDDQQPSQPKVRVEYNWEAYEYHPSNMTGVQLPLEPETTRLDLRIPTPEWWTTNLPNSHNLLLSPSNANPMVKIFENLNSNCNILTLDSTTAPIVTLGVETMHATIVANQTTSHLERADSHENYSDRCESVQSIESIRVNQMDNAMPDVLIEEKLLENNQSDPVSHLQSTSVMHSWSENEVAGTSEGLLDLDYSSATKLIMS